MSLTNYIRNADHHFVDIKAFDGTFDSTSRRTAPYLYLTVDGPAASTTISIPMTRETSKQLYDLADRAEEYWEAWDEFQHPEEPEEEVTLPSLPRVEEPVTIDLDALKELGEAAS